MCGIFGFSVGKDGISYQSFEKSIGKLFKFSQQRGQDSAGIVVVGDDALYSHKEVMLPSEMIKSPGFLRTLEQGYENSSGRLTIIGHCRLVTNGSYYDNETNHPIAMENLIGTHNGIVLNAEEMEGVQHDALTREHWKAASDTQLFFKKLDELTKESGDLRHAIAKGFGMIEGTASIALVNRKTRAVNLATNTGSLYYLNEESGNLVFASERDFLRKFLTQCDLIGKNAHIRHLAPGRLVEHNGSICEEQAFDEVTIRRNLIGGVEALPNITLKSDVSSLRRCTRCILPETYPFIEFDGQGECNFCREHETQEFHGSEALERLLSKYRSSDGSPDCLVGLSGGRDSCYGLHVLVKEYGMHPLTYTYDWGMTTDVSRRNSAKVLGRLGLEHILRSAPIQDKRYNIGSNIRAWLKRPEMGMVPLFMAGDKEFYQYGRSLRKEAGLDLTVFCSGHLLEQREFFVGFCGVNRNVSTTARAYDYHTLAKVQLAFYYIGQYLRNPAYINRSFFDSVRSFLVTFLSKDDFLYLYEYLRWDEKEMERVLRENYDWEDSTQFGKSQWRMGDGHTAFTNYIWHTVAGFSEFDNFRSNQVREGLLTREEAIELAEEDNRPKMESLEYFAYLVGFNLDDVLSQINTIPKMY
jgi:glucosamine--fructose-6-phosphate aminotransferase (isomerizing)